jgi:hypothetical protein
VLYCFRRRAAFSLVHKRTGRAVLFAVSRPMRLWPLNGGRGISKNKFIELLNYGHTQLNPPHPVRSAQLNSWWQSQYYGGGPHGNTLCCNFLFFLFLFFLASQNTIRTYLPTYLLTNYILLASTITREFTFARQGRSSPIYALAQGRLHPPVSSALDTIFEFLMCRSDANLSALSRLSCQAASSHIISHLRK